ncbi:hypothetical protein NUW54_g1393 [Trametes sanguinea]|uniref:Uncharacterized protein n=1 Tax=Trametes sanguinea TaxID=158606 RepID=A0ACC1Q7X2_9APHY|nr:hypothetical protein NUW54_g1393 [Trametes sanguinea]
MHIPFTPNHIQLISACYPPSAALLTSGPEYAPNSQELSRLTYYAANRPEKMNKLGTELEKRVKTDTKKAAAGNTRARAALLITLAIFKALATECRRDMSLLSPSLLSSINITLSSLSADLELAARAATVFTTWTTYTDGLIIGVDLKVTDDYMSCLRHFARLGHLEHNDHETRNRTRLIGLAALASAVNSEALYKPSAQFQPQVSIIMRALMIPLLQVDVSVLNHELAEIKEQPNSPILDEFRSRPNLERRAASIHAHIDGDQGPTSGDVANTALRATSSLLGHTRGLQASLVLQAALDTLDERDGWGLTEHCRWLAEKAAEWTQYQYRYGIPTRLVECLAEIQDAPQPTQRHATLAAMITAVFTSPTPLVNLSTSDIIASLISITLRRITVSPDDSLLPALVECISSLGTHVYYADQIQDLAEDLIRRLVIVEASGIPGAGKDNRQKARTQAVRCLLAGLLGLIHAADMHDAGKDAEENGDTKTVGTSPTLPPSMSRTFRIFLMQAPLTVSYYSPGRSVLERELTLEGLNQRTSSRVVRESSGGTDMCPSTPSAVREMQDVPYGQAVGSLFYLAVATRPDIARTVGNLARFSKSPGMAHWKAVKHLFRYIKGTLDYKLTYSPASSDELFTSYTDG